MNKKVSMYGCSWLAVWWVKGVFYSSCFPCSEHNRVREFPILIIWSPPKIGSCIFHPPENFERGKRPTFLFFSCQLCLKPCSTLSNYWAAFILPPALQRVSYTDVRALRAAMGLTAPAQPLLGPPGARSPLSAQSGAVSPCPSNAATVPVVCWDPSVVCCSPVSGLFSSPLSFSSCQEPLDGPWPWFLAFHLRGCWWTLI